MQFMARRKTIIVRAVYLFALEMSAPHFGANCFLKGVVHFAKCYASFDKITNQETDVTAEEFNKEINDSPELVLKYLIKYWTEQDM